MKLRTATAVVIAASALATGIALLPPGNRTAPRLTVETVTIKPTSFAYRLPGEFLMAGRVVDGARHEARLRHPLEIMTYQVSAAEYAACVAGGACQPADSSGTASDRPVTGVSYLDAVSYAEWLSSKTGEKWRLPTDEEWAFAAAERFGDNALGNVEAKAVIPQHAGSLPTRAAMRVRRGMRSLKQGAISAPIAAASMMLPATYGNGPALVTRALTSILRANLCNGPRIAVCA